jgi:hypothetical protein
MDRVYMLHNLIPTFAKSVKLFISVNNGADFEVLTSVDMKSLTAICEPIF